MGHKTHDEKKNMQPINRVFFGQTYSIVRGNALTPEQTAASPGLFATFLFHHSPFCKINSTKNEQSPTNKKPLEKFKKKISRGAKNAYMHTCAVIGAYMLHIGAYMQHICSICAHTAAYMHTQKKRVNFEFTGQGRDARRP